MSIDVFISYSRIDQPFVIELDAFLSRAGLSVWFDKKSLLPGKKWEDVIEDQINEASVFLTCMSQSGLDKRGYFHVEQNLAVQAALRRPPEELYILPVTLGTCEIPRQFRRYNVVNLAEPGAIDLLLVALSEALDRKLNRSEADVNALRSKLSMHTGVEQMALDRVGSYGRQIGHIAEALEVLIEHFSILDSKKLSSHARDVLLVVLGEVAALRRLKADNYAAKRSDQQVTKS